MSLRLGSTLIVLFIFVSVASGEQQTATSAHTGFETASVRPAHWSQGCYSRLPQGGMHYELRCVTLRELIAIAWQVHPDDIEGGAGSALNSYYDLKATTPGDKPWTQDDIPPMLRSLLDERFHVSVRRGTKEVSGYMLEIAKGGAKLKPSKNGAARDASQNIIISGYLRGRGIDMMGIVALLSSAVREKVVDRTGITGNYDVDLSYASRDIPDSDDPSLFTAIKEQLGLRLEAGKVPINTIFIEHADQSPTVN